MKLSKVLGAISLTAFFLAGASLRSFASTEIPKAPVLLQINEFNVLYSYPKQPYLDEHNRLMIPLRAISELLGGQATYNAASKEASINLNGKSIILTSDSKTVIVDGVAKVMDTTPVIYKQSFIVPIRVLLDYMEVKASVDSKTGIVHIEDNKINNFEMIQAVKESDLPLSQIAAQYTFLPLFYDLSINDGSSKKLVSGHINITAKNISGEIIPKGKEDLHPIFLFDKNFEMEADKYITDQERPRPELKKDQIFQRYTDFSAGSYGENLKYILVIGRELK